MVIIIGNGHVDDSSNPVCISHSANTLGKGMNPTILSPPIGKKKKNRADWALQPWYGAYVASCS